MRSTGDTGLGGARAAVGLPLELTDRVGVAVDRHLATGGHDLLEQPHRRIEPLGPTVDLDRLVEVRARAEHEVGVERRLRSPLARAPCGRCSGRGCRCCGLAIAATMRSVIGCSLMRSFECTLATTTSSSASRSASWSRRPSSRMSTSTPVRMRNGASSSLSRATTLELRLETLGVETVRDRERRRVVGEREVLVAELGRLAGHLLDGGPTVGPVGVQVEVALERGADRRAGTGVGRGLGLEARQVLGHLAGERLVDRPGRCSSRCREGRPGAPGRRARAARRAGGHGWRRPPCGTPPPCSDRRAPARAASRSVPAPPPDPCSEGTCWPPAGHASFGRSCSPGMVIGWGEIDSSDLGGMTERPKVLAC